MKRAALAAVALATVSAATTVATSARAEGFGELGRDIVPREKAEIKFSGYLRTRGEALHNFDLDRGPTPSGQPLFPVSRIDPKAQTLTHWDMRARMDVQVFAPGSTLAVKMRLDALDNLVLGSVPDGVPSSSTSQRTPEESVKVRRAWGEALLPFGLLVAGRMSTHWGLGLVANGGECLDCDSVDASDRIGFISPLAGHIFALAYDFSASGPIGTRPAQNRYIDLERGTSVRTATFAFLKWYGPDALARRRRANKASFEYGSYITHRWQSQDIPGSYLPTAQPVDVTQSPSMARGFTATGFDVWLKLSLPSARIEAEASMLLAQVDQASLVPGVLFRDPVKSTQFGAVLESDFGKTEAPFAFGFDAGYASGDSAPGFGVVQKPGAPAPKQGDLDGAQANPPKDNRVDNFRFHPDYRIDRILFREILGAVTDAAYVKPHARLAFYRTPAFEIGATASAVGSMAMYASSTPGGKRPLGIELDPSLHYAHRDGFQAALDYAILFPLGGLDNTALKMSASPAQLIRLRLGFMF